ncbi:MAG: hypothetical protein P4L85_06465 [Paludisphaera borealis]|uniref:hypothetical protein n=1 Tax=Paludisphaera borealis TaxID=1387353 RepID=UPI00283E583F|nr:hypothetical protein [Paludisphaera borealis]MDR3618977.1 hypothetical protein [Paludisphaera borealis]
MRTTKFRCGIVGLALVIAAGCGGATGVESSAGITGPPPKAPTDDMMKPSKSKKSAKSKVPSGFGGPPPIPKH